MPTILPDEVRRGGRRSRGRRMGARIAAAASSSSGGGGGISDPTEISDLELWLDASHAASITDSSGDVSAWADRSANGFDFSQGSGGIQPRTGDATRNGLNVISFAASDVMARDSGVICADAVTAFMVFAKTGSANTFEAAPLTLAASGLGRPYDRWSNNTQSEFILDNTGQVGYTNLRTQTAWCVLRMVVDKDAGGAGTHTISEYKDGTLVDTDDTTDTYSTTSQVAQLGGRNGGTTLFTGDIAEVVVYNAVLSTSDAEAVESYLNTKWGF